MPSRPGLAYEIDWETVDRLRVDKPQRRPEPVRLLQVSWPDGKRMYLANTGRVNFVLDVARAGKMRFFQRGVTTELVPDDGSTRWRELYQQARSGRFMIEGQDEAERLFSGTRRES